jgi:DNA-binding SARP family transcriptional activator
VTYFDTAGQCPGQFGVRAGEVEVAVLGPVEFRGTAAPFARRSAGALVAYLALHPRGATNDVWSAALWPDRSVASSTVHSTTSVARRALGRSPDGCHHLTRRGGRLGLGPAVGTDAERFARAAASPDPARWREALSLVRGQLFEGLALADWAVLEGIYAELESMVVATALKAADEALLRGQGEEAEWMIRRGLRVSPYDERLYRGLLRSTEAKGNCLGLRATMAELRHLAAAGEGADIHPQTVALYRELARIGRPEAEGHLVRL